MSNKIKLGIYFGVPNQLAWVLFYSFLGQTNEFNLAILMFFSLTLVLGMFLSTKNVLWKELGGVYERRPLFQAGMATGILISMSYSIGYMILLKSYPELTENEDGLPILMQGALKLVYGMFFTFIYALVFPFMHKMNPAVKEKPKNN